MSRYDNETKQIAWESWLRCREKAKGDNDLKNIEVSSANSQFERWWKRNYGE